MIWSIETVEEALVAVHELWWRSPGGGRWPYAGDGPWHLIQGVAGDYAGDGVDGISSSARPRPPLDAAEVRTRDAVTAWLQMPCVSNVAGAMSAVKAQKPVTTDHLRRLIWRATEELWRGEPRVPWKVIDRTLRFPRSIDAMAHAYRRTLAAIACSLNGWPERRARAMAATFRAREDWPGVGDAAA